MVMKSETLLLKSTAIGLEVFFHDTQSRSGKETNLIVLGSTSILHDNQRSTDVGHCKAPGCFTRPIAYNSTLKQIISLIQQSSDCRQLIQVMEAL
jgi:hypothetical protein